MRARGAFAGAVVGLGIVTSALGGQKGTVRMETVAFGGWQRNLRITNGDAELLVTLEVGPRVLVYRLVDGENVFKVFEDQLGSSGEPDWQVRGGHRLWTSPEDLTRTYAPDNQPVTFKELGPGAALFQQQPDQAHGIRKEIEVHLEPKGSRARIVHRITNTGDTATELAPWALTVMAAGGMEIIPMPAGKPHPGAASNAKSPEDFAPDRTLVLWPYFDFSDPRWEFGSRFLFLHQDETRGPTKLGLRHREGWVGYLNGGDLFIKHVPHHPGARYPDRGVNYETFTNQDMLEMESLGPLTTLAPGAQVEHVERWEILPGVGTIDSEGQVDRLIVPRITGATGTP